MFNPIQLLQVFNSGKPCGWLGQTPTGFWFHYGSNNPQQQWVSLLMPPSTNFYRCAELFPVFAQHLPREETDISPLDYLQQSNGKQLGALSFANPDNPMVKSPLRTPPPLMPGQCALVSEQARKPMADTLVHHKSVWSLVKQLRNVKKKVDPNNRLHALRWAMDAELREDFVWHPRPDLDTYRQQLIGFEQVNSLLNLGASCLPERLTQVLNEVVRTYCKNHAAEIELLWQLMPLVRSSEVVPFIAYEPDKAVSNYSRPRVLGMQYLPFTTH